MERRIKGVLSPKASGSITITENGNYDVVDVANAIVEVPIPEGYVKPEGTLNVTSNGTYDVTEKKNVSVNVQNEAVNIPINVIGESDVGTLFSNETLPLTRLYFNTSLSDEEIANIGASYIENSETVSLLNGTPALFVYQSYVLAMMSQNDMLLMLLANMQGQPTGANILYQNELAKNAMGMGDFVGWNPTYFTNKNYVDIKEILGIDIESFDMLDSETALNIVSKLVSANVDFKTNQRTLSGEYDGNQISVTENGKVDIGALIDEKKLPLTIDVNVDLSGIVTLKQLCDAKEDTKYLFANMQHENIDGLINFDTTKNVTNMNDMFRNSKYLKTVPLFDTSKVKYMDGMFYGCTSLEEVPLFNTKLVWHFNRMFYNCSSLKTLPPFDMTEASQFIDTFYGCSNLETLPYFNTDDAFNLRETTFYGCSKLHTIGGFNLYWCISGSEAIFNNCPNLKNLSLYNLRHNHIITSGNASLITKESLIQIISELIDTGSSLTLTISSVNLEKLTNVYVKVISEEPDENGNVKLPFEVCESTDEGAMLITNYVTLKNWALA